MRDALTTSDAEHVKNRLLGVGIIDDPHPVYHRLRAAGPVQEDRLGVHFGLSGSVVTTPDMRAHPDRRRFWVHAYNECEEVFRDDRSFSSTWYLPMLGDTVGDSILSMDEPDHRRHRILLQKAFSRGEVFRWQEEFFLQLVDEYLDGIESRGRADLYQEICAVLPIHTIIRALGLPVEQRSRFYELSVLMVSAAASPPERLAATREIAACLAPFIAERRRASRNDLVGILSRAALEDEALGKCSDKLPLTDAEINSFVRLLIVAGAGTTYRQLGTLLLALLLHPEQLEAVAADRSLIAQAIEESLRWEPAVAHIGRIASRDVELGGVPIPSGSVVNVNISGANRDPARWEHPDTFEIFRAPRPHLAFGFGRHRCLGIHLARMEMAVALGQILDRLRHLRLDAGAPRPKITGLSARMPTSIPVRFG